MTAESVAKPVGVDRNGEIGVIVIDSPPVNALSHTVRDGISQALRSLEKDEDISIIVIAANGRCFVGGADIKEFGLPPKAPLLPEVCNMIENCSKPVIAAVNGAALGGGFELVLAAHYRVASHEATFAFPEVNLGLLPGAGGTQRAPRLAGVSSSLQMALSGKPIGATEALAAGYLDKILPNTDFMARSIEYASSLARENLPPRRTRDATAHMDSREKGVAAICAAENTQEIAGQFAKRRIIEASRAALDLPFEEGLRKERELFLECMHSSEREALIHIFFAEKNTLKQVTCVTQPQQRIGVVGGGTMGSGISAALLASGLDVVLIERDSENAEKARSRVGSFVQRMEEKGQLTSGGATELMSERFGVGLTFDHLGDRDVIIEAVFEDIELKKAVFAQIEKVARPDAVLATNTSYLDVNSIAGATGCADRVIGLHFFSPAHIMKLVEIVVADVTSRDAIAAGAALAKRMRKIPVISGNCDGFIGNRIQFKYRQAADYLMEDGATPYEIDQAIRNFGFKMGPFQVSDLAGGDIGWATRKRKAASRDARERYVAIGDRICENGWFGQKTGRGYYVYGDSGRTGASSEDVLKIIVDERRKKGIVARTFSQRDIVRRCMAALINEGAKVLEEKIAAKPSDIDVVFVNGYGFPRERGGPMKYADMVGLPAILEGLQIFAKEDSYFWSPSPLLERLVSEGRNFSDLNVTPLGG